MAPSFIRGDDPDQQFLLPPDARQWLPPGHLAWHLQAVVSEFDLSEFLGAYRLDGRSRPAYHPQAVLTLVMYCYCKGVRSSRAIEMACWDDVGARVIMGNQRPDHSTLARFVTRHRSRIKTLLTRTLVVGAKEGLVHVDVVAGDGTIVKANASMTSNVTAEQLDLDIGELEAALAAEVEAWLAEAEAADAAEDALFDADADDSEQRPPGPGPLSHTVGKLLRRREARHRLAEREAHRVAEITAERAARVDNWRARVADRERALAEKRAVYQHKYDDWQARNAAAAGGLPGTRPVPADQHAHVRQARQALQAAKARYAEATAAAAAPIPAPAKPPKANTTDPASRIMKGKQGGYQQNHNVQVIAGKGQFIFHIALHDNPTDVGALHPSLAHARDNLDAAGITEPIGSALFDAGYGSNANFTTPTPNDETTLYVAVTKEARQTGRQHDTNGRHNTLESWKQMAARLATDEGKTLYKQRAGTIEPVFAQLFNRAGRYLNYRGEPAVTTELTLLSATHNILKIIKHRVKAAQPAPATT